MVSMKDIAVRCGVSIATVSKALNGQSDISDETRKKITRVADELGYLTNSAARALKTNRTFNLGVLFEDEGSRGLTHEFFAAVLNSFKSEAEASGYDITFIGNQEFGSRKSSYLQHCRYRGVDGLVIACVDFHDEQVLELISSDLPIVTIDHLFRQKPAVLSDNVEGTAALVRFAYERGHRKIAFIHGEDNVAVTALRFSGFQRTTSELKLNIPEEYIVSSFYYQPDRCYQAVKQLLSLPNRPTCILFPDDFATLGGIRAIEESGLKIPDDISFMGYDGILLSEVVSPRITTYRQDTAALGSTAARKLIQLIENPDITPEPVIVSGKLIPGESVNRIPITSCD